MNIGNLIDIWAKHPKPEKKPFLPPLEEMMLLMVKRGDLRRIKFMIQSREMRKSLGLALREASKRGDKQIINILLGSGAFPREMAVIGVLEGGHLKLLPWVYKKAGWGFEKSSAFKYRCFLKACMVSTLEVAQMIGVPQDAQRHGISPAARSGNMEILKYLSGNLQWNDGMGERIKKHALKDAIRHNQGESFLHLLEHSDLQGDKELIFTASCHGNKNMIDLLISKGATALGNPLVSSYLLEDEMGVFLLHRFPELRGGEIKLGRNLDYVDKEWFETFRGILSPDIIRNTLTFL